MVFPLVQFKVLGLGEQVCGISSCTVPGVRTGRTEHYHTKREIIRV